MNKSLSVIIIILIIFYGIINAQGNNTGALYREPAPASTIPEKNDNNNTGALYKANSSGPGDRPGDGEGIGQESVPVSDGIIILLGCCIFFVIAKICVCNQKKTVKNKNSRVSHLTQHF